MNPVAVGADVAFVVPIDYAGLGEDEIFLQLSQNARRPYLRQHLSDCHIRLFLWIAGDYACRALERSRVRPAVYSPSAISVFMPSRRTCPKYTGRGYALATPSPCPSLVAAFLLTRRANQFKVPTFPDGDLQDVDDAASEVLV